MKRSAKDRPGDATDFTQAPENPDWMNFLKPKGTPGPQIRLAQKGKTEYRILLSARPTSQEEKAAADLALWLEEITGAAFPIVYEEEGARLGGRLISIGNTKRLEETNIGENPTNLRNEGYEIAVKDRTIYLRGGETRGIINAVYVLLEEDLGCRWYTSGRHIVTGRNINRIPHHPTLEFHPVPRSYVPTLKIRDPYYIEAFDEAWSLRNRTNSSNAPVREEWGGRIDYAMDVHSFNQLVPPSLFEAHPEYFMLNDDGERISRQLCLSNPQIVPIAVKKVLEVLKSHPDADIVSVSANDGGKRCLCLPCRSLDKAADPGQYCHTCFHFHYSASGSLLHFVNQIAEAVEKEYPHILVSTLGYNESQRAPIKARCRDNVAIRLCNHAQMLGFAVSESAYAKDYRQQISNWSKLTKHLLVWEYTSNFQDILMPTPNMHALGPATRHYVDNGVTGIKFQGNHGSTLGAERALMRVWVMAKLLWDPSRDVGELQKDFIWGFYGAAAPEIFHYYELLDELAEGKFVPGDWTGSADNLQSIPVAGAQAFHRRATAIFDRAEALTEDESLRQCVELERLSVIYAKLNRGVDFIAGLGEDHVALIDRFESIARRANMGRIGYRHTVDQKAAEWRKQAAESSAKNRE